MARKKLRATNRIEPSRPSGSTLIARATTGMANGDGKNKSVWQSFVDSSGFSKRHPNIMKKGKSNAKNK